MHFTANSKEVYTSVLCFINYMGTKSAEMQPCCMSAYESELVGSLLFRTVE